MKIQDQTRPALQHLAELIGGIPVAMMTTLDDDGALSSRPMAALEMDAEGALWFFTDLRSAKVVHLRVVNLAFTDPAHGTWVSLSGRGEVDTDPGRIHRLWSPVARPWFPEGPESSSLALLKFIPDAADYWDGPNSRMQRVLGVLVSALAGRPVGLGEHGTHTGLSAPATDTADTADTAQAS